MKVVSAVPPLTSTKEQCLEFDRMFWNAVDPGHHPNELHRHGDPVHEESAESTGDEASSGGDTSTPSQLTSSTDSAQVETQLERLVRERKERLNA